MDNGELLGYAYVEASPEFQDGSVEFIGTKERVRNRDIGTSLLQSALSFLFQFQEIEQVRLTVEASNPHAVRIYEKAGFTKDKTLVHFVYNHSKSS